MTEMERIEKISRDVNRELRRIMEQEAKEKAEFLADEKKKEDKRRLRLEQSAAQAREDIDNYAYRIEQLNKKGEYLELERDACIDGGKEWNKWNDKCMANDDKIYRLQKQMNKAQTVLENAERELSA